MQSHSWRLASQKRVVTVVFTVVVVFVVAVGTVSIAIIVAVV